MTPTNKDLTTTEDRLILSKPPPPSLILCRLFAPAKYPSKVEPTKDQFDPNQGYEKCRRCPDHIECIRYLEASLYSKGIAIKRHVFSEEEKKHYRRLHDARDK